MALRFSARSITSARDLRGAADDEAVVLADLLEQLLRAEVEEDVHLEVSPQKLYAGIGELLGYEDPQAVTPLFEKTLWAAPTPLPSSTG